MEFLLAFAPVLFGVLLVGLDDDDDDDFEDQRPEPETETEPADIKLGKGDPDFLGTDQHEVVNAGDGFTGSIDGGGGSDLITADGGDQDRAMAPITNPAYASDDIITVRGNDGDTLVGLGKGVVLDGYGDVTVDVSNLDDGIVQLNDETDVILPTRAGSEIHWDVGDDASLDLTGSASGAEVYARTNAKVTGSEFADRLTTGGDLTDLSGGAGNDTIDGSFNEREDPDPDVDPFGYFPWEGRLSDGNNVLDGGEGDDVISADLGDTVTGGEGDDTFEFALDPGGAVGHVTDFDPEADTLNLTIQSQYEWPDLSTEEVDGDTHLRMNGEDVLVIEGRTGLSFGVNRAATGDDVGDDSGYADFDGNDVDPAEVDVVIERLNPYA